MEPQARRLLAHDARQEHAEPGVASSAYQLAQQRAAGAATSPLVVDVHTQLRCNVSPAARAGSVDELKTAASDPWTWLGVLTFNPYQIISGGILGVGEGILNLTDDSLTYEERAEAGGEAIGSGISLGSLFLPGVKLQGSWGQLSRLYRDTKGAIRIGGRGAGRGKAPMHHVMTNKNSISTARGGPWTPRFEDMAKRAGMTLEDAANKVAIPGHRGPHPAAYHAEVFDRLSRATEGLSGNAYSAAFRAELDAIRAEAATAGSALNRLIVP